MAQGPAASEAPGAPALPGPGVLTLRGRVVTDRAVLEDGLVVVDGARIAWVGPVAEAPPGLVVPARGARPVTVLPGLLDLHCHGGGGVDLPGAADPSQVRTAVDEHLRHGTTGLVASLVTADDAALLRRTEVLAAVAEDGDLLGLHLEGPFLSTVRCGAQDPGAMSSGRPALVRAVADAARGHLVTMTVAPEVPGVVGPGGVIETLVAVGAVPSIGHADADDAATARALAEAAAGLAAPGARSRRPTVTHLFNGMTPLHHRRPGPVAACLAAAARGEAVVELVADGVHLAPGTVRAVFDLVGPDAVALVTDATAATGMPDGDHVLGGREVRVTGGVARLADGDALAGGTSHLLDVVRTTVAAGVGLVDAVHAASATPAAVLGRTDRGMLAPGLRADLVVTDDSLHPLRVLRAGCWVDRRPHDDRSSP